MLRSFRSILAAPAAYRLWWKLVGGPAWAQVLVQEYIQPMPGAHILEIGCGPGTILRYLPQSEYLGFDLSSKYIAMAKKRLSPNDADSFYGRALEYAENADYDQAIRDYDQALRINPTYVDALFGRGLAYAHRGDYSEAIQDYNHVLQINPTYTEAFNSRGVAHAHMGEYSEAIRDYDQALTLSPRFTKALHNRSLAYAHSGAYLSSVRDFGRWIQLRFGILGVTIRLLLLAIALAFVFWAKRSPRKCNMV